jgi:hypothetical protein
MKKVVNETEVDGEGIVSLMGEKVILMCMNYSYVGTLISVNETCVLLDEKDAAVCYETGPWSDASWKDAQRVGRPLYVMIDKIEAFAKGK